MSTFLPYSKRDLFESLALLRRKPFILLSTCEVLRNPPLVSVNGTGNSPDCLSFETLSADSKEGPWRGGELRIREKFRARHIEFLKVVPLKDPPTTRAPADESKGIASAWHGNQANVFPGEDLRCGSGQTWTVQRPPDNHQMFPMSLNAHFNR